MKTLKFYHAGCPVCVSAEEELLGLVDKSRYDLEIIHLGERKELVSEAKQAGVKSVPALKIDDTVLHINFGASISDLEA